MTLILDIDFDAFVNPVARNLEENGERLSDDQYNVDDRESIYSFLEENLFMKSWVNVAPLTNHIEVLGKINAFIENGLLSPPFDWVHVDAHDDLYGHWDMPSNSGNFLYQLFLNEIIAKFTFVYRENAWDFPDYILNENEDHTYRLEINGLVTPVEFGHVYEYVLPKQPDFIMLTQSPSFTPESIDEIYYEVVNRFEHK
ncbi:hypothetical protein [uncultured Desulfobacter sp.]|uniref:hypothetical protein n=1 Tax=uncultured Desulfobacter sp. TaxID=240139 RepID=UPI0029F56D71|nr:hypothetical protein [uncultured Desulfobacter sp.]